jgi:hypothetical protein
MNKVGEYYVDLDEKTNLYCVFHTESRKAFASYCSEKEAKKDAKERNMKPKHKHDCTHCVFLGTYLDNKVNNIQGTRDEIDCYWCDKPDFPSLSSILGRYGSEGPEYFSYHPPEAFADKHFLERAQAWYLYAMLKATLMGLYKGM